MHKQDIGEEGQETWLRSGINIALIVHCVDMTKTRCTAALWNTVKMNAISYQHWCIKVSFSRDSFRYSAIILIFAVRVVSVTLFFGLPQVAWSTQALTQTARYVPGSRILAVHNVPCLRKILPTPMRPLVGDSSSFANTQNISQRHVMDLQCIQHTIPAFYDGLVHEKHVRSCADGLKYVSSFICRV